MAFQFFNPLKTVTVTQGDLPHWDQEGATYFITWRLADSIPRTIWEDWQRQRSAWLRAHDIDPLSSDWRRHLEELSDDERRDFRRFSRRLEDEMDAGHGSCCLGNRMTAGIVADALQFFDGSRYTLGDFVVMPNHIHLLVGGMPRAAMIKQVESWKKWSALKINNVLKRKGRLWQDESFDHLVRSEAAFQKFRSYIAQNPVTAKLSSDEYLLWQPPG